jgi:hypothetical protein
MAAELAVVKDEQPGAITADLIAAALERRKAENATPLEHFDNEIGGVFRFRKLSGAEVRECGKLATIDVGKPTQRVDRQELEFLIVNKASVEPKVTKALWNQLLQLGPMVTGQLGAAVLNANGMGDEDPVEAAAKSSTPIPS